jgi:hypothetical protein
MEKIQERDIRRDACVKFFLLYLFGCLLSGDKSNKHIELIYLTTMEDYATMDDYSWGGMTLAYLYHCLSEVSLSNGKALGGSTTLLMVINCVTLLNLNIFFCFSFLVITYKCDLFGLCRDGFWRIFLIFSVLMIIQNISQTI